MPSSTSCTEYATSSAQSITCASRQRRPPGGAPARSQSKTGRVVGVHTELALPGPARPRILAGGVERGPGEVEPGRRPSGPRTLASSRVSTRSVCALPSKPPQGCGELVQRVLAVVPERRVPEVVGEPGDVHHVRVAAEPAPISRAICATSSEWVSRVRRKSSVPAVCTWVLAASRRNAAECSTRARSRSYGAAPCAGVLGRLVDQPGVARRAGRSHGVTAVALATATRPNPAQLLATAGAVTQNSLPSGSASTVHAAVVPWPDVDVPGAHVDQPLDLGLPVGRAQVDVQPVLASPWRPVTGTKTRPGSASGGLGGSPPRPASLAERPGSRAPRPTSGPAGAGVVGVDGQVLPDAAHVRSPPPFGRRTQSAVAASPAVRRHLCRRPQALHS